MKRAYLLVLAGGLLAAVAFFLPTSLSNPQAGLFSPGPNELDAFRSTNFFVDRSIDYTRLQVVAAVVDSFFEALGAVLIIAGGLLAFKWPKTGSAWALSGAVLGLTYLLWGFTASYEFYLYPLHFAGTPAPPAQGSFGDFVQLFGSGYWLALIGLALGCVGALIGWRARPAPHAGISSVGRVFHILAELLLLASCVVVTIGYFIPSFVYPFTGTDVFDLLFSDAYLAYWPAVLALLLLLVGGLFGLRGSKGAYLASLAGALTGLVFALEMFPDMEPTGPVVHPIIGYWVVIVGYALGLLGAVVGLLRPAAPARVQAAVSPAPF